MKYVNKAVIVEAVEFFGFDKESCRVIFSGRPDWLVSEFGETIIFFDKPDTITIRTKEGDVFANVGDYIVKGSKGEIYPCDPVIFEADYEIL